MITEKSCGAIVYTKDSGSIQYVIIHSKEGIYGFPKGYVEINEVETAISSFQFNNSKKLLTQVHSFITQKYKE